MKVLVLGAAVSGRAAAALALRIGDEVVVYDRSQAALEGLREEGLTVFGGDWDQRYLAGADVVVTSPGVPEHSPPLRDAMAADLTVWSELEYAARQSMAPIIAVTGTNGKTTTVSLIADILMAAGRRAVAVGNIGAAFSDAADGDADLLVVEASSFQLRFIETFHPEVAVILNVAPDHLDWHGAYERYRDAKGRIVEHQERDDHVIFDVDDEEATRLAARSEGALLPVSGRRRMPAAGVDAERLWVGDDSFPLRLLGEADPGWRDPSLLVDVAAAAAAAALFGAGIDDALGAIRRFRRPPHRRATVGSWSGVTWVDDSKATNPHAAAAAAAAYPSVVLIAGGRNKGLDLSPLASAESVRRIVAIGEAAGALYELRPDVTVIAEDMEDAVAKADAMAERGDTVLLAPGCASFDQFASYAERGDAFAAAVLRRKERA